MAVKTGRQGSSLSCLTEIFFLTPVPSPKCITDVAMQPMDEFAIDLKSFEKSS